MQTHPLGWDRRNGALLPGRVVSQYEVRAPQARRRAGVIEMGGDEEILPNVFMTF